MRVLTVSLILATLVIVSSCSNPAADKSKAVTGEATSSAAPIITKGEQFGFSGQNSRIEFVASKVTGSHNGAFKDFSGSIDFAGQPEKSRVNVTINMVSVSTDTDQLTQHLKTPDFFDVAKFPQATFVSTEIRTGGEKGASHTVTGNFQLHGVTKSISFPATINVTSGAVTIESNFSINRKDFGINYAGAADNLIRDEVVMSLHIRGEKAK